MTDTTTGIGTELVAIQNQIGSPKVSLADVLSAIAKQKVADAEAPATVEKAVGKIGAVSGRVKEALKRFGERIELLNLPDTARTMTDAERAELLLAYQDAKAIEREIKSAVEAMQLAVHNHLDAEAARDGRSADLDKHDHLVLEGAFGAPGDDQVLKREVRGGGATPVTVDTLRALEDNGTITHAEFLKLTYRVNTRAVDETTVMRRMATDTPFFAALVDATGVTPKTTALSLRKASSRA